MKLNNVYSSLIIMNIKCKNEQKKNRGYNNIIILLAYNNQRRVPIKYQHNNITKYLLAV